MSTQTAAQLGITIRLNKNFDEALAQATAALKAEGFGVLTDSESSERDFCLSSYPQANPRGFSDTDRLREDRHVYAN